MCSCRSKENFCVDPQYLTFLDICIKMVYNFSIAVQRPAQRKQNIESKYWQIRAPDKEGFEDNSEISFLTLFIRL